MIGANEAILRFATRSAVEFPTAKMVSPIMASERPKISPRTVRTETTSSATKPSTERERRYVSFMETERRRVGSSRNTTHR